MTTQKNMNRRQFIGSTAAAAAAFTVIPRHVMGGAGYIPPSEKLNLAYIGCGTQGVRELLGLLKDPNIQIVAVCDPNKFTTDYVDWSRYGIRDAIREALGDSSWGEKLDGIPGGRDLGMELVNTYYTRMRATEKFRGCASYADFRELLEKETDINAVKIMTPDHLHATVAIAAMKKGLHVVTHKPIANRMYEARLTIETARKTGVSTHLLAWSNISSCDVVRDWIKDGAIGTLMEIHNWTNRPVWPQWTANPTEKVPVPAGMDWDLWLGPVPDRPYHPNFTHAVFRGWYDFGAGSIADMGTYSLWPLFMSLGINTPPVSAEAYGTTTCEVINHVSVGHNNEVAFPYSCMIHFRFPVQPTLPAFDLFWYDGGMRPPIPEELDATNEDLPREGMMFVGDKGKILADFRTENPRILPEEKMIQFTGSNKPPETKVDRNEGLWVDAFRNGRQSPGSFLKAGPVTETILLGAVALQARKKIRYDTERMKITNVPEANKFLVREYRKGWEL